MNREGSVNDKTSMHLDVRVFAELIRSSRVAREVWREGIDLLDTEFENRVNNPAPHPRESLVALITRLLRLCRSVLPTTSWTSSKSCTCGR